jgi:hypothetical protein
VNLRPPSHERFGRPLFRSHPTSFYSGRVSTVVPMWCRALDAERREPRELARLREQLRKTLPAASDSCIERSILAFQSSLGMFGLSRAS